MQCQAVENTGEQVPLLHADFSSSELCPGVGGLDHREEFWRTFSKRKGSYCLRSVNCCTTSWVVRKLPWMLSLPCANWWMVKTKEKPNEHTQCALWVTATGMDLEDTELRQTQKDKYHATSLVWNRKQAQSQRPRADRWLLETRGRDKSEVLGFG